MGYFARHSKSSAIAVSLMVHAVLIVAGLFLVAITVVHKNDVGFEAKSVKRPHMNLRKLQVPVNLKKPQQPKLRKQIVVKPNMTKITPDIRLPEIVGVKGGMGAGGVLAGVCASTCRDAPAAVFKMSCFGEFRQKGNRLNDNGTTDRADRD